MAVDPKKTKKIVVVHGVQTGGDQDQNQHEDIRRLVESRLNGAPLDFRTEMYRYENLNDAAQQKLRSVLGLFLENILAKKAVDLTIDLVGDVVIALHDKSTAHKIREGLVEKILGIYEEGSPLYLVAHSLGTIYAFDAVNQLLSTKPYFNRDDRTTWPVQALVTLGSPIGLEMFRRTTAAPMGPGKHFLRWHNYWDALDPVVSGSFYGSPQQGYRIAERFVTDAGTSGWDIQDRVVNTGKAWLMAHTAYWNYPPLGDDLASLMSR